MPQYLSAAIVEDFTLYPIHSRDGDTQYAGHVCLWSATENEARTIAAAMCQAPIVGVEITRANGFGKDDTPIATIGKSYAEASRPVIR